MRAKAISLVDPGPDPDLFVDGAMSVADACAFAGVGRTYLYAAMDSGAVPFVKKGRRRLIPRRALIAWLASAE